MWQKNNEALDLEEKYKEIIEEGKSEDKIYYLYIQIAFSLVMILTSFLLKGTNQSTFQYAKKGYSDFFEKEGYVDNSFSYDNYVDKIQREITEKFEKLTEVFNQINK